MQSPENHTLSLTNLRFSATEIRHRRDSKPFHATLTVEWSKALIHTHSANSVPNSRTAIPARQDYSFSESGKSTHPARKDRSPSDQIASIQNQSNHSSVGSNFGKTMISTVIRPTARWRTSGGITMHCRSRTGISSPSSSICASSSHLRKK